MPLPTGLSQRSGVWQLRIGVPADLRHLYPGVDAYRGSLKTRDRSEAVTKAHSLHAEFRTAFDKLRAAALPRTTPASPRLTAALIERLEHRVLADDDLNAPVGERLALVPLPSDVLGVPELSSDPLERMEQVTQALQDYADALAVLFASGDFDMARKYAAMTAEEMGVPPVDWREAPAELPKFARAVVRAYQALAERARGGQIDTPAEPATLAQEIRPAPSLPQGHTLAEVFQEWQKGKKPDAVKKTKRAMALAEVAGITSPIEALTRQDGLKFRDHINTMMAGTSGKTRSDVLASVQALLNFALKEKGWIDSNPWAGTAIAKGRAQKREPWDNEALTKLLHSPLTEDRRLDMAAQYWLPLLALMTGARQAELCQLRVDDVIQRDGVWLLDINEDDADKSVKSAAGERWVAIHSKLIALGFIDHVEAMRSAGQSLVFPGILTAESRSAALYVSDWFRARCKALGLYQRWRDFHALRTTVGTALRAVDPPLGEALITAVMGHEAGNVGAANYHRPAAKTLQRVIETLDFPAVLALPRVYPLP